MTNHPAPRKVQLITAAISSLLLALAAFAPAAAADVDVKFTVWKIPGATHYPHDPMVHSKDGSIWYASRMSNTLGRFDPKTEEFSEYTTRVPNSGPHGLKEDADGNIYFTAISAKPTYIGKLDVSSGKFTEYPITFSAELSCPGCRENAGTGPGRFPKSAHSLSIDQKGTVWFSMFGDADMLGRLVPSTGKVTVAISPKRKVGPYAIQIDSKGIPWYGFARSGQLARVNPDTMAVKTFDIPFKDGHPRRINIAPDDSIWYTDYMRGGIGHYDPKTDKWEEWLSPGGEWSRPYGMVIVGDALWYSETFMNPSNLVRFDMKTEEFQSWETPECFGGAYYIVADADDNLWFTCHDTDRLVRVEIH